MIDEPKLLALLADLESFRVERTISTNDTAKFREAICAFANDMPGQERILVERRRAAVKSFDAQACMGSSLQDLALDLFLSTYRTQAIAAEVIAENGRPLEQQMASLRLFDLERNSPTHAAILLFAKDPLQWLAHACIQYVRFDGVSITDTPISEKRFSGDLLTMLRTLESFVKGLPTARPVSAGALREDTVYDFPPVAIRELLMNAVMHRSYEASAPIRFYQFTDRIEISSPGPLYGEATPANFPRQTSYRNPVVAEALKVLGFVNQFGRGVARTQDALHKNGSQPARFEFGDTYFGVTIPTRA